MSFFYNLEMEVRTEPMQVLQLLVEHLPFQWQDFHSPYLSHERKRLIGEQVVVYARALNVPSEDTHRRFGFDALLAITIEIYGREQILFHKAVRTSVHCANVLLEHLKGDAVMLEYGEAVLLQRLQGHLILNAIPFAFPEYRQALPEITLPYEMQELPYPTFKI